MLALTLLAAGSTAARAADDPPGECACHAAGNATVRARSPIAAAALEYGLQHSPTLQALLDRLKQTDIVAYVDSDLSPLGDVWGRTSFISKTEHCRYVRVLITAHINLSQAAALLAHELQHVYEIATHPEVVDDATLSAMYRRVGQKGRYANTFDSEEALEMGARVAAEIYSGAAASAKSSPAGPER
jgi:hypothetical protein